MEEDLAKLPSHTSWLSSICSSQWPIDSSLPVPSCIVSVLMHSTVLARSGYREVIILWFVIAMEMMLVKLAPNNLEDGRTELLNYLCAKRKRRGRILTRLCLSEVISCSHDARSVRMRSVRISSAKLWWLYTSGHRLHWGVFMPMGGIADRHASYSLKKRTPSYSRALSFAHGSLNHAHIIACLRTTANKLTANSTQGHAHIHGHAQTSTCKRVHRISS